MYSIILFAALYGMLNAQNNLVPAPNIVVYNCENRPSRTLKEWQANRLGYKLVIDEPPQCFAGERCKPTGWEERVVEPSNEQIGHSDNELQKRIYRVYSKCSKPKTVRTFSKYAISEACIECGEFDNLTNVINSDSKIKWMWDASECIKEDCKYFQFATNALISTGTTTEAKINDVLNRAQQLTEAE